MSARMTVSAAPRERSVPTRGFMVVWQDPATRSFLHVARLEVVGEQNFGFAYTAEGRQATRFRPFAAFPDIEREYRSEWLFSFFANRVMSARRPDFPQHLSTLGLTREAATPMELLARTGGRRATDTIQVVPEPVLADGVETVPFLVSGVRHTSGADARIAHLQAGQALFLRDDTANTVDPRALLLDAASGEPVGWVPRYLLDYVHKRREEGADLRVLVEHANGPDVPWHLRLLCRLEVRQT